jgi:hypothetical protein
MAKEIKLTKGYVAIVDDEDYDWLSKYKWSASVDHRDGQNNYVSARTTMYKKFEGYKWRRSVKMHRLITNAKPGEVVDHANGNPLDNRRANLRIATAAENARNHKKQELINKAPCTSRFKGVTLSTNKTPHGNYSYWRAQITVDGVNKYIGQYKTEEEAACMYDIAAAKYHSEYARPNFDGAAYDEWYDATCAND